MNWKALSLALIFALPSLAILMNACLGLSHNGFKVYIDPHNNSARFGHTISINISISNVSAPGLWAYEFKLHYDKSLLELLSARIPADHFLKPTLSSSNVLIIDGGTTNLTEGTVSFAVTLLGAEPGKTGSGTLANVTFVVVASGRCALTIGGYLTGEPKFVDGNGNAVPNTNYSLIDGSAEGLPPPSPPISPPPLAAGKQAVAFDFLEICGYLIFPEECHPKDVITHQLVMATEPGGIHLNFFRLNISCNTASGERLLHNVSLEDEDLSETWILNETMSLTLPADATGKVHCIIETETYKQFATSSSRLDFYTTSIRTMTFEELQTAYKELLNQYNATVKELEHWKTEYETLNSTYHDLLILHNVTVNEIQQWRSEYQELNSTYHELLGQHNATCEQLNDWIEEYEKLNSTYDHLQENYALLNSTHQKLQIDYGKMKSSYDSLEANYQSLNQTYSILMTDHEKLQASYNDLGAEYNGLNATYQALKANYTNLMLNLEYLGQNLTLLQNQYQNLFSDYTSLNSAYSALLGEYETTESENSIASISEPWISRTLWFAFAATTIGTSAYIVYASKKKGKYQ